MDNIKIILSESPLNSKLLRGLININSIVVISNPVTKATKFK